MTDFPDTIEVTVARPMRLETGGVALEQGETGDIPLNEYLAHPDWYEPTRPQEARILEALAGSYQDRVSAAGDLGCLPNEPEERDDKIVTERLESKLDKMRS